MNKASCKPSNLLRWTGELLYLFEESKLPKKKHVVWGRWINWKPRVPPSQSPSARTKSTDKVYRTEKMLLRFQMFWILSVFKNKTLNSTLHYQTWNLLPMCKMLHWSNAKNKGWSVKNPVGKKKCCRVRNVYMTSRQNPQAKVRNWNSHSLSLDSYILLQLLKKRRPDQLLEYHSPCRNA